MYAELRPMLLDKSIPTNEGVTGLLTNKEQMRLIVECVKEKQAQLDREGRLDEFPYGLKIVYCTPRSIPKHTMEEEMRQCIELKLEFPDLICGTFLDMMHNVHVLTSGMQASISWALRIGLTILVSMPHNC